MKTDWSTVEPFRVSFGDYQSVAGETFGVFIFRFGQKAVRTIAVDGGTIS